MNRKQFEWYSLFAVEIGNLGLIPIPLSSKHQAAVHKKIKLR